MDLLAHRVAAVVDQHVDRRQGARQRPEEDPVLLVADEDGDARPLELLAGGVDVDAEIPHLAAEVVAPQVDRAALRHAELDQADRLAAETREMAVVDLEVVMPFVEQPAVVLAKEGFQVVHRTFPTGLVRSAGQWSAARWRFCAERCQPIQQARERPVRGDHAAVRVVARRGLGLVELRRGEHAPAVGLDQLGPQGEPDAARRRAEFLLQADQLGLEPQVGGGKARRLHHGAKAAGMPERLRDLRRQHARRRVRPAIPGEIFQRVRALRVSHLRRIESGPRPRRGDFENQVALRPRRAGRGRRLENIGARLLDLRRLQRRACGEQGSPCASCDDALHSPGPALAADLPCTSIAGLRSSWSLKRRSDAVRSRSSPISWRVSGTASRVAWPKSARAPAAATATFAASRWTSPDMCSNAAALRWTRSTSPDISPVRRAVFSIVRAAFATAVSIACERAASVCDTSARLASVCASASRLPSSSSALMFSLLRVRLPISVVMASSRRTSSERPAGITGGPSPSRACSAGESRLPPVSSTCAMPVSPWVTSTATVFCLIGVPRSMSSVSSTFSTLPRASAMWRTRPTWTPRYRTGASGV